VITNDLTLLLLEAPEGALDSSVKPLIEKWDEEPTSIQILEVLDQIVRYSLGSDFVVQALDIMWKRAMEREGITIEECVSQAVWREE
jgi:DNA-binding transcriptional ArsR family regulator